MKIIAIDSNGKQKKGTEKIVPDYIWTNLLKFGKSLRWEEVKTKKDGRKKRSGIGNAVKEA